jgi:hypothetical protein
MPAQAVMAVGNSVPQADAWRRGHLKLQMESIAPRTNHEKHESARRHRVLQLIVI